MKSLSFHSLEDKWDYFLVCFGIGFAVLMTAATIAEYYATLDCPPKDVYNPVTGKYDGPCDNDYRCTCFQPSVGYTLISIFIFILVGLSVAFMPFYGSFEEVFDDDIKGR